MFCLVYVSRADHIITDGELLALLRHAREKNIRIQVTGMLLYKDGNFMQLLEGEEPVVRGLFKIIEADVRHCNVTLISEDVIENRLFPSWSMGFQNLKSVDAHQVPGYSEFLNVPLTTQEFSAKPSRGQELLLLFKRIG